MTDQGCFVDKEIYCALSGGGYRATFFHVGVLRALVRLGLKDKIKLISSTSGGSITNALFGLYFDKIRTVEDFDRLVKKPLVELCDKDVRNAIVVFSLGRLPNKLLQVLLSAVPFLKPKFSSYNNTEKFAEILDESLYNGLTLSNLSSNLRVVMNSTNLNTGVRWRFDNHDFGDYKTGYSYDINHLKLADAVAASAAFPLLFSPYELDVSLYKFFLRNSAKEDVGLNNTAPKAVYLTDGGVYDNMATFAVQREIERNSKCFVVISDAAKRFVTTNQEYKYGSAVFRISDILLEQLSNRDRQNIMIKLLTDEWQGIYFKLENSCRYYRDYKDEKAAGPESVPKMGWPDDIVNCLGQMRTDLDRFNNIEIDSLIYHGESLLETTLAKWHFKLYSGIKKSYSVALQKPNYNDKDVYNILKRSDKRVDSDF
ncbi:MAG: patatin-like phospholipase family protein [Thermincolia bacterium]